MKFFSVVGVLGQIAVITMASLVTLAGLVLIATSLYPPLLAGIFR